MSVDDSVSQWVEGLRQDCPDAAKNLWQRYFQQLVALSGGRLPGHVRRDFDEEDVAISAFNSLCEGVREGRFPELGGRQDLWSLMVVITARKVAHRLRHRRAARRGGPDLRGESALGAGSSFAGIAEVIGREPSPEFAAEVAEESMQLFGLLEPPLRQVALLKTRGLDNVTIAQELGCGLRTVERRLGLVRRIWNAAAEERYGP